MMEGFYLADRKFLAGNSISIADLLYSCELDEMQLLDGEKQVGFLACPHLCTCNATYSSLCICLLQLKDA